MSSLEKVAFYLDAFQPGDANYDFACYIKEKLANVDISQNSSQSGIHEEENNNAQEVETSEFDKTKENYEGNLMQPAFQDLDVLNQLDKQKQEIKTAQAIKNFLNKLRSS
jgi:hypothetical protein